MRSTFLVLILGLAGSLAANQNQTPTPPPASIPAPSPSPDLNGHWEDHGTKTYPITIRQSGSSVVATHEEDYVCDPRDGRPRQTTRDDFSGTLSGRKLTGQVTVCGYGSDNKSGTGLLKTSFTLTLSDDGKTLAGTYHNTYSNTDESMTLERGDCEPQYRPTTDEVMNAILKACQERGLTLPQNWKVVTAGSTGGFVRPQNKSPNGYPNGIGFVLPLENSSVWVVGSAEAPCMGSGNGEIVVKLMVWSTRLQPDGHYSLNGLIEEDSGKGSLDEKGLNQAMGRALDAAKLNRFKVVANPG